MTTLRRLWWVLRTLARAGFLAPLRPDKYVRLGLAVRRYGVTPTLGFALAAIRQPSGVGLIDERGALSWAELDRRSSALAASLAARPGGPPATVAILCRNHRGFVDALSATAKLGADALLLNTGFSAPQLAEVLAAEDADLLIYDEEFTEIVAATCQRVPGLSQLIAWSEARAPQHSIEALIESETRRAAGVHRWRRHELLRPRPPRRGKVVLLTSGTTGAPKGARRSGGGVATLAAVLDRIPWRSGETTVVAAPMFHAWGFGQLVISATMTCTIALRRRFDPAATLALVEETSATGLSVVPVMLERIVELPADVLDSYRLASLRFVSASGSRMRPEAVLQFLDRYGDVVYNSYNATEAGMITIATPADLRASPDTAGRPAAGVQVRIVDESGDDLPPGEVGSIIVRSDSQFEGYTAGNSQRFHDGYMITGDLGKLDAARRLYVVGRDDEMIVSGGENVYPLEVEQVLNAHEGVREVAVIGVDDEQYGQRLAAFVVLHPGASLTPEDLKLLVKQRLAGYKVPRDVTLLAELPRNAAGKVVTRMLESARQAEDRPTSHQPP